MDMDDTNPQPPADYHCQYCPNRGVKLWREAQTFRPHLFCANCAAAHEDESITAIDAGGGHATRRGYTFLIGNLVPAIPTEDGTGFWGWFAERRPLAALTWWQRLPTLSQKGQVPL
jgi:hypothetical protein